jgi:hypothetical protein
MLSLVRDASRRSSDCGPSVSSGVAGLLARTGEVPTLMANIELQTSSFFVRNVTAASVSESHSGAGYSRYTYHLVESALDTHVTHHDLPNAPDLRDVLL